MSSAAVIVTILSVPEGVTVTADHCTHLRCLITVTLHFRRKVRKEFLFKYLHAKRVEGIDPAADKSVIISHVLALWGVNDQGMVLF